jgi:uncharacterized protein (TIGR04222 family)
VTYAAAGDTWGLSGPGFLVLFFIAAAALLAATLAHRHLLRAPRPGPVRSALPQPPPPRPGDLGPYEAAYLSGGPKLAVHAAHARLHRAGAVGLSAGRLVAADPLPEPATALERAVHHAARDRTPVRVLPEHPSVVRALAALVQGLERADMAVPEPARRRARWGPALLLALVGVGVVRAAAGIANDRPVAVLVISLLLLSIPATALLFTVPRATTLGERAVAALRERNSHLNPTLDPAYASYGDSALPLAVALFGASALWVQDSSLAHEVGARQVAAGATGGSGGGDGGGGCGSSGGCGGCGG